MSTDASTKRLASLLKRLRTRGEPPAYAPAEPALAACAMVQELIFSLLLWESSTSAALAALRRLHEQLADANDLRVCPADDLAAMLGDRYPLARERAMRLRSALGELSRRPQGLDLSALSAAPKREAAAFLEALAGLPPFVASRLVVCRLQGHAVPMDERLRALLVEERVIGEATPLADAASWLARQVKTEDALATHLLLQAWSDEEGHAPARRPAAEHATTPPPAPAPVKKPAGKREHVRPGPSKPRKVKESRP